jgi:hypothetical protein
MDNGHVETILGVGSILGFFAATLSPDITAKLNRFNQEAEEALFKLAERFFRLVDRFLHLVDDIFAYIIEPIIAFIILLFVALWLIRFI